MIEATKAWMHDPPNVFDVAEIGWQSEYYSIPVRILRESGYEKLVAVVEAVKKQREAHEQKDDPDPSKYANFRAFNSACGRLEGDYQAACEATETALAALDVEPRP